jgi:hypothetical protein
VCLIPMPTFIRIVGLVIDVLLYDILADAESWNLTGSSHYSEAAITIS